MHENLRAALRGCNEAKAAIVVPFAQGTVDFHVSSRKGFGSASRLNGDAGITGLPQLRIYRYPKLDVIIRTSQHGLVFAIDYETGRWTTAHNVIRLDWQNLSIMIDVMVICPMTSANRNRQRIPKSVSDHSQWNQTVDSSVIQEPHRSFFKDFILSNYSDPGRFNDEIAQDDEMFYKAIVPGYANVGDAYLAYMQSGKRMLDALSQLIRFNFGDEFANKSILEFACGYGRFTRHLVMRHPTDRTVVSDIYRGAVDWQNEKNGMTGIYSVAKPEDFALISKFDVIFVGSLFSHLPKDLFVGWLERLFRMLSPDGFIAFSVHDVHLAPNTAADFVYDRSSESASLSHDIYGMTYVSEGYVREAIEQACGPGKVYRRYFKGLYENQDLYVVPKSNAASWAGFQLQPSPIGGSLFAKRDGDRFMGSGWALNIGAESEIENVTVIVGGRAIDTVYTTPDDTGEIAKYFPGIQSRPVHFKVDLPIGAFPKKSVVKCRVTSGLHQTFDVYLGLT